MTASQGAIWKAADEDIWRAVQQQKEEKWTTKWVKAHADRTKKESDWTIHEKANIQVDKLADTQHDTPTNIEQCETNLEEQGNL